MQHTERCLSYSYPSHVLDLSVEVSVDLEWDIV